MDAQFNDLSNLFSQLGLETEPEAITHFLNQHSLKKMRSWKMQISGIHHRSLFLWKKESWMLNGVKPLTSWIHC